MDQEDVITEEPKRVIITDYANALRQKAIRQGSKYKVRAFRGDQEFEVFRVPLSVLRFRKQNGRLASDVLGHRELFAELPEDSQKAQELLGEFIDKKSPDLNKTLYKSLASAGQLEPAIVTVDGFLINGNRRKRTLEKLTVDKGGSQFSYMDVVILPGDGDEGGAPLNKEIKKVENALQAQNIGKADYTKFDQALSMREAIQDGYSLSEQMRDDPEFGDMSSKEFASALRSRENEYLKPLECIDEYLTFFGAPGVYSAVAATKGDPDGRWQAFLDYSNRVQKKLDDPKELVKLGVKETEIGRVQDVAFTIIRQRVFSEHADLPKLHKIMRDLPDLLKVDRAKKELFKLNDIDHQPLPKAGPEGIDDRKWVGDNQTNITRRVVTAYESWKRQSGQETVIKMLEDILSDLQSEQMDPDTVTLSDLQVALSLLDDIKKTAKDVEKTFFDTKKKVESQKESLKR